MARGAERGEALRSAAGQVAYEHGIAGLTLATVAEAAQMPLGSIYYYFKTRDDVVAAVVERLEAQMRQWIGEFEALSGPAEALKAFARAVLGNADHLTRYGCPIGTLTAQLRKEPGEAGQRTGGILGAMAQWAAARFAELGLDPQRSRHAGRMMLVRLEGAAMMAHATGDPVFVSDVVGELDAQIDGLVAELQRKDMA